MCNEEIKVVLEVIITILDIIRFFVPVVLIIFCTIDIFKIIVSKKEEEIKKLRKGVLMKVIYAVLIYLIPFLVPFIFNLISNFVPIDYNNDWKECYDIVKENKKNN